MTEYEKVVEYETQIEDMLRTIQERLDEFGDNLSPFQQGRQLAYEEMMDIIKTRHKMILDVLSDD